MGSSFSIFEPTMKAAAILVAAGSSTRMGFDKLTAPLAGQPLLFWSLQAIQDCAAKRRHAQWFTAQGAVANGGMCFGHADVKHG